MRLSTRNQVLILLVFLCLATGCKELVGSLKEISKLQQAIIREYGEPGVNVNLNNSTSLIITFINSPLNAKTVDERARRAQMTAAFVKQHYSSIRKIEEIWIGFVKQETRYMFVNYSEGLGFFGFDKNGQPLRQPENEPTAYSNPTRPTATYSSERKQTDIVIEHLQLERDAINDFSVMLHFTVPGDATGAKRATSLPEEVRFDFSSSSEKSLFPDAPHITFLSDGKVVYETTDQFSTWKFGEKFSETLSLPVPYRAFRRMTSGNTLTLRIGDREYQFTREQVDALREMTSYVKE
jgi:hypothetical protein